MNDFTPGPWQRGPYDPRLVFGKDGGLIAECCRGDATEDLANARLIAAAPMLYEALVMLVGSAGAVGWIKADDALALADGDGGE